MRSSQQLLTLKEQKMRDLQTSLHSEVGRGEEEEGEGWGGGRRRRRRERCEWDRTGWE